MLNAIYDFDFDAASSASDRAVRRRRRRLSRKSRTRPSARSATFRLQRADPERRSSTTSSKPSPIRASWVWPLQLTDNLSLDLTGRYLSTQDI
jgi:hypothetical protein